jgi:pimeloyl-ACP methyl ester carboxylesterase
MEVLMRQSDGLCWMQAGPPVAERALTFIFIGGYGCNKEVWRHQLGALSDRYTCIAVDMPGHGASTPDLENSSIEGYGRTLHSLREHLGLEKPVLVGHSMGGRVALETSRQGPDLWGGVLLLDVSRAVSPDHKPEDKKRLSSGESHKAFRAHMRAMFEQNFSETCPPEIREEIRASSKALDHATADALTPSIGKWDHAHWEEAVRGLKCPLHVVQSTYLVYGRSRKILEPGDNTPFFDMIREIVPDIKIDMIRTGHFSMLEEPGKVTAAIESFAEVILESRT